MIFYIQSRTIEVKIHKHVTYTYRYRENNCLMENIQASLQQMHRKFHVYKRKLTRTRNMGVPRVVQYL